MVVKDVRKRCKNRMEDPEVKKMFNWIQYANRTEEPQQRLPCFPSPLLVQFMIKREEELKRLSKLKKLKILEKLIKKLKKKETKLKETQVVNLAETQAIEDVGRVNERLSKLNKLKKRMKILKKKMELKDTQEVNLAETQAKDVGEMEDLHVNMEELKLDVSASSLVDQLMCRKSPCEQTGNSMVEGLKLCTTEAEKKTASHSEGI